MKKINFIYVFLAMVLALDVVIPITIPEVNYGTGFALFILLAVMLGVSASVLGRKANDYFRNQ